MRVIIGDVLQGQFGTATEVRVEDPPTVDQTATLVSWFLHCPGQSPAWSHYLLTIIHLRPIEGVRPARISVPHATHEVMLFALDPTSPGPSVLDPETWRPLTPYNTAEQLELPDDDEAILLLRLAAQSVVDGVLPAEPLLSGAREPWRTVLIKTAAHARGEEHAP